MEENTISMLMDVKLDIRERKLDFSHMKSWSQYYVRVEAVKCFPCYMRISFFSSPTDRTTDLIVRINVPGMTVQMATSRTKQHSYGLFWKNNRKRCCAYFALETQLLCERHLRWMKKSIRNLELYRQEMMQLRRASRTPAHEIRQELKPLDPRALAPSCVAPWDDLGIYQNLDATENMADLQDILGPLPMVPTVEKGGASGPSDNTSVASSCSRRVSGVSGIYEEIRDDLLTNVASRLSRVSIASGIYEEMRPIPGEGGNGGGGEQECTPPPLPPRQRLNTNEDFGADRGPFRTPEVDYLKKKRHWLRLDSVFGRKRTTSGDSQASTGSVAKKGATKERHDKSPSAATAAVVHRSKVCRFRLTEAKRNSFSSPDLSRLNIGDLSDGCGDAVSADAAGNVSCDNLSDGNGSCTSEFYPQHPLDIDYIEEDFASSEYIHLSSQSTGATAEPDSGRGEQQPEPGELDPRADWRRLNLSERIFDSFNRSANSSTVNLAGAGCTVADRNDTEAPKQATVASVKDDTAGYLEMGPPGTGFNRQKLDEIILRDGTKKQPYAVSNGNSEGSESIYMIMSGAGKLPEPIRSSSTSSSSSSSSSGSSSSGVSSASDHTTTSLEGPGSGKQRSSIDDKIASYYPNDERTPSRKGTVCSLEESSPVRGTTTPPVVTTLPRAVKSAQRSVVEATVDMRDRVQATFRTPKATAESRRHCFRKMLGETADRDAGGQSTETSPKLYQKYATVARTCSPKKCAKSKPDETDRLQVGSAEATKSAGKRFGSLPRFGKLDLSPLRMKINSVLQRHNSGNL
ncbi:uncharacterized protein LOC128275029 [Anopheles cruzii]|uniref:uncharacterized protein LOC128275029 n=1 Tax=Anopheles cruzii TaxID=68878 RepID=UPI0022EC897B|nr:uncharacterized protein LOC128275029 [Anopheles cruzii]